MESTPILNAQQRTIAFQPAPRETMVQTAKSRDCHPGLFCPAGHEWCQQSHQSKLGYVWPHGTKPVQTFIPEICTAWLSSLLNERPTMTKVIPIHKPRILRKREVIARTGIPSTSWDRGIRKGYYPKGFLIGGPGTRAVGWLESDIDALIERLATAE